jgi:hypothetical protein
MGLLPSSLTQGVPAAHMHRRSALQVRETEVHPSVSSECSPKQGEKCLILVDGQELPVGQRPAFRGEDKAHDPDFRQERFRHFNPPYEMNDPARLGRITTYPSR